MDFKKLMQTMQEIDEGREPTIDECGMDMPAAIIQGGAPADESLNMNVTINSKGADGIRDLMDILKGISSDSHHEPMDEPDDDAEIVIGDSFGNEVDGDSGQHTYGINTVLHQGDKKDGEARKVNGGGQPQPHFESLVQNLAALYEDIKSRK
jgi:hypothetical protein